MCNFCTICYYNLIVKHGVAVQRKMYTHHIACFYSLIGIRRYFKIFSTNGKVVVVIYVATTGTACSAIDFFPFAADFTADDFFPATLQVAECEVYGIDNDTCHAKHEKTNKPEKYIVCLVIARKIAQ